MNILFPKSKRPYYIVSPSYTHTSSGVRTLHLLCHALNLMSEKAYMWPDNSERYATNPALDTPIVSQQHHNYYDQNLSPIVVYHNLVKGNPLGAKHVVRYLLSPIGTYGGETVFPDTDNIWASLPSISEKVLRLPVSDTSIFYPFGGIASLVEGRRGSCFYSQKYDVICGNKLLDITKESKRLEGSLEEIADILRRSEVCYVYEVSSIITEAALCGCPVVLVRTPYFDTIDPECMMGDVKWNDGEIVKQCDDYSLEYSDIVRSFWRNLQEFIKDTQEMSCKK